MDVILLKDVEKVGRKGEVVKVRDGYARNFLLPRSLALHSTYENRKFVEEHRERARKRFAKEKAAAEEKAAKMKSLKVAVQAKVGENDKLFGSVTSEDIREALAKQGHAFEKKQIHVQDAIRKTGSHTATVEIYPQVKVNITVEVTPQS